MTALARKTHFTAHQIEEAYPPGIERYFWHQARNAIIARTLARAGMDAECLLEIGCGTGIVVGYLRERGIDCIGCDLASAPVNDGLRAAIFSGTDFRDLPATTRQRIQGVLLCDVIEHLPDISFLADVRAAFPALRQLLVTVPARRELWSQWDDHYGHYRRYDRQSLAEDLQRGGAQPSSLGYFFHGLYGLLYLTRRQPPKKIAVPRWPLLHKMLGVAFRIEHELLPRSLPGTSLIAVAGIIKAPAQQAPGSVRSAVASDVA
jgi:hypothetical protein